MEISSAWGVALIIREQTRKILTLTISMLCSLALLAPHAAASDNNEDSPSPTYSYRLLTSEEVNAELARPLAGSPEAATAAARVSATQSAEQGVAQAVAPSAILNPGPKSLYRNVWSGRCLDANPSNNWVYAYDICHSGFPQIWQVFALISDIGIDTKIRIILGARGWLGVDPAAGRDGASTFTYPDINSNNTKWVMGGGQIISLHNNGCLEEQPVAIGQPWRRTQTWYCYGDPNNALWQFWAGPM